MSKKTKQGVRDLNSPKNGRARKDDSQELCMNREMHEYLWNKCVLCGYEPPKRDPYTYLEEVD